MSSNSTASNATAPATDCGNTNNDVGLLGLRVGALFIIMFTSMFGALFPVISKRFHSIRVPTLLFEYVLFTAEVPDTFKLTFTVLQNISALVSSYVYTFKSYGMSLLKMFHRSQQHSYISSPLQPLL